MSISFHFPNEPNKKGEKTHRNDSGVVWQKVTWCDMAGLVFSASNIQCQLNRTLWTKIITGTVLQEDQISCESLTLQLVFYFCISSGVHSRELVYHTDNWYNSVLTLEYCILSTMSSLVRGMRPGDKRQCCYGSLYKYQTSLGTLQHYINHDVLHWKLIITLGYIPTLCATNSSWSTDELASIWIQSIAANKVMQV